MLPSALVCVVLTGLIVLCAWAWVDRRLMQLTIWSFAGLVWLVQTWRWSTRLFGLNYRLTNHRLIVQRGHWRGRHRLIDLARIQRVDVEPYVHSRWTGVGRLVITVTGEQKVALDGVRHPHETALKILEQSGQASGSAKSHSPIEKGSTPL
jgi:uncharacterized membrane protein YdbT with pleckstrin-like domain